MMTVDEVLKCDTDINNNPYMWALDLIQWELGKYDTRRVQAKKESFCAAFSALYELANPNTEAEANGHLIEKSPDLLAYARKLEAELRELTDMIGKARPYVRWENGRPYLSKEEDELYYAYMRAEAVLKGER